MSTIAAPVELTGHEVRVGRAELVYRISLYYTIALTIAWLFIVVTGIDGGRFFPAQFSVELLVGTVISMAIFWAVWAYGWYFLKRWRLRRLGLSDEELAAVFGNRLDGFDLGTLLARYPERRLRIIDMIARRGRTIVFIAANFSYVYLATLRSPGPDSLVVGLQAGVFDSIIMNWLGLAGFRNRGVLGRIMYGAQARILDGVQGRANALCIGTLWSAFRFVMVPLGVVLSGLYPPNLYAVVYAFIWITYAAADFASEIFGSLWGRHNIHVWGLGDLNKKSWEGVAAGFVCALVALLAIVWSQQLGGAWYGLALVLALINPVVELVSPRGSDDFTMATLNALICVAFGWWVF